MSTNISSFVSVCNFSLMDLLLQLNVTRKVDQVMPSLLNNIICS